MQQNGYVDNVSMLGAMKKNTADEQAAQQAEVSERVRNLRTQLVRDAAIAREEGVFIQDMQNRLKQVEGSLNGLRDKLESKEYSESSFAVMRIQIEASALSGELVSLMNRTSGGNARESVMSSRESIWAVWLKSLPIAAAILVVGLLIVISLFCLF